MIGLGLQGGAEVEVVAPVADEPSTVLHVVATAIATPTLVDGRPQ